MKKLYAVLIVSALILITGCSSKGDFELKRSKGITVAYTDTYEKTSISPMRLTSDDIFNRYSNTIVRGTIESIRNIKIDYGKKATAIKALASLKIDKVISGNAAENTVVTVLLPSYAGNASEAESSVLVSRFRNGTKGIFLLNEVTEDTIAEANNRTLYYDDLCDYYMFGEDHFAIIAVDNDIIFNPELFDDEISSFASLAEAEAKIRTILAEES